MSARRTIFALLQLAKLSVSGALDVWPSLLIFWNTGDSCSRNRM